MSDTGLFVGMDVHKTSVAIAVAEAGHNGEARFIGNFSNSATVVIAQLKRLAERHGLIECAYEAGACAYTLYRRLIAVGIHCIVVAPSRLPNVRGRMKNDHRDVRWPAGRP